jgi:nucleoside-diphosphate-sugar epimerase
MSRLKATIIGGRGFIGSHLIRYLSQHGWDCDVPERNSVWPDTERDLGHIFYCAGLTGDYYSRAQDTIEAHVSLLGRVLASTNWKSLVYLSSTRLYDGLEATTLATESLSLSVSSLNPRHLFDLSKLTGEALCIAMGHGKARIARLSCVYNGLDDAAGYMPALLRRVAQARPGEALMEQSSPQGQRDYVHLPDVLDALSRIALQGTQSIYNVASGKNTSNQEIADWVFESTGRRVLFGGQSSGNVTRAATVAVDRLRLELGCNPVGFQENIRPWLKHM